MLLTKTYKAFTMIELIIVISIIGILTNASINTFRELKNKTEYEKFIFQIQHYTEEAKNRSLVNESEFNGINYSDARSHGVVITQDSINKASLTLFKDNNGNNQLDNGEELKTTSIENIIEMQTWTGIQAETSTAATAFTTLTLLFKVDPDPVAIIKGSGSELLREVDLKFAHIKTKGPVGNLKKYNFDTITKISQINDYPILIGGIKTNDTTLTLESNEILTGSLNIADFNVSHDGTNIPVTGAISSTKNIILSFDDLSSFVSTSPFSIIYKNGGALKGDNIILQNRNLEINFE
jgi:prepilin-type N-terminal cleavage/methylation domain-containing protein